MYAGDNFCQMLSNFGGVMKLLIHLYLIWKNLVHTHSTYSLSHDLDCSLLAHEKPAII